MNRVHVLYFLCIAFLVASCSSRQQQILQGKTHPAGTQTTSSSSNSGTKSGVSITGSAYIDRYKNIAIAEMNKVGIPASIKLAQALLESGAGNSYLAKEANNHFGIKCGGSWNGRSVTREDDALNDCFRVYNNPEQSFKDHSDFLLKKRYEALFRLDKNDYKGWARGLKSAGYATNPRYADLLIDMIERYELYKYDRMENTVEKEKREELVLAEIQENQNNPVAAAAEPEKSPVAMRIHEVQAKETLYSLSRLYQVSIEQIKTLNALVDDSINIGQLLVISK